MKKIKQIFLEGESSTSTKEYLCFPDPGTGPRPQFVFTNPGSNLYLLALALNLYLPALTPICIYGPDPNSSLSALAFNLYLPALAN